MANQQVKTSAGAPPTVPIESAGVEALIGRIRDSGIVKGQAQAEALIAAAKQQAAEVIADAHRQGEEIVANAKSEGAKLKAAAEDALRLATRDAILSMESDLIDRFQNMVSRLVKGTLEDPAFLQKLILEVAGRSVPRDERVEVLLPDTVLSLDDLKKTPESAKPGTLMHFVLSTGGGLLREGVTFGASEQVQGGIRVQLTGEDVHVEITPGAVSELILSHMLPRFRALLRGAVVVDTAALEQVEPMRIMAS
jgi:V/A-type H+-transporting ATPase subunit E